MFRDVRISNLKGLKSAELVGLGRINVICGRNNSGKSTVLEALNSPETRHVGRVLDEEAIEHFCSRALTKRGWESGNAALDNIFRSRVESYIELDRVYYVDEVVEIIQGLYDFLREDAHLAKWHLHPKWLQDCFLSLFPSGLNVVMLPAKRQLEVTANIAMDQRLTADGVGVLNSLFYLKSQVRGSVGREQYEVIAESFQQVTSGYEFDISPDLENKLNLSFSFEDQPWRGAADSGIGLRDVLMIMYFACSGDWQVVLIEEPENHLHPDMQRKLMAFLAHQEQKQFFLTTHSNVFLSSAYVEKVLFTKFEGSVDVDDATSKAAILYNIGYDVTDNLVSDLIVLVEGPTDVQFLEEFLKKLGLLEQFSIKLWPLGGDIMGQVDLGVFAQDRKIFALIDRDDRSQSVRAKFEDQCAAYSIPVHRLERYALENYYPLPVLQRLFSRGTSHLSSLDPDRKLEEQLGFSIKDKTRFIAREMTLEDIEGTDLRDFLRRLEVECAR